MDGNPSRCGFSVNLIVIAIFVVISVVVAVIVVILIVFVSLERLRLLNEG